MAKNWNDYEKEFDNNPKKTITKGLLWVICVFFLVSTIFWVAGLMLTPAQTTKEVIQKTLNSDNVIQNYEWFKQQFDDYKAINVKIVNADSSVVRVKREAGTRDKWSFEDKEECNRLTSVYDGLKYQKSDIIAKYNARSKMINRNLFQSSDLPSQLSE